MSMAVQLFAVRTCCGTVLFIKQHERAQWLSGKALDSRPRGRASPASLHCGPRARHIYPSLVLVQPRKTCPCLTERLLMGT